MLGDLIAESRREMNCSEMRKKKQYYYTSDSLKNLIGREHSINSQYIVACELDMINVLSAAELCIYHVKFNVCLVTKPFGEFSETKWLNASLLFLSMNL